MTNWIWQRAALFAEHFDLKYGDPEPGELDVLSRRIAEAGEPVLELGCGTGRVLVPLLMGGVDVTGVDASSDMLDRCRAKYAARGLSAKVHVQSMQMLDLPSKFGTVFMGSCGLGVLDSPAMCRPRSTPFSNTSPRTALSRWRLRLRQNLGPALNRAGVWSGGWDVAEDGSILVTRSVYSYEPETHARRSVMIFHRDVGGRLHDTELHETTMRFWDVETVTGFLGDAGFTDAITAPISIPRPVAFPAVGWAFWASILLAVTQDNPGHIIEEGIRRRGEKLHEVALDAGNSTPASPDPDDLPDGVRESF